MPKGSKVEKMMHEFKAGTLHSGSRKGPKVVDFLCNSTLIIEEFSELYLRPVGEPKCLPKSRVKWNA